jgi:hypothetical protein
MAPPVLAHGDPVRGGGRSLRGPSGPVEVRPRGNEIGVARGLRGLPTLRARVRLPAEWDELVVR